MEKSKNVNDFSQFSTFDYKYDIHRKPSWHRPLAVNCALSYDELDLVFAFPQLEVRINVHFP